MEDNQTGANQIAYDACSQPKPIIKEFDIQKPVDTSIIDNYSRRPITLPYILENPQIYEAVYSGVQGLQAFQLTIPEINKVITYYFEGELFHHQLERNIVDLHVDHKRSEHNYGFWWDFSKSLAIGLSCSCIYFLVQLIYDKYKTKFGLTKNSRDT